MTFEIVQDILQWSAVINIGMIIFWAVMIMAAGDFVYKTHSRLFPMSKDQFFAIHYTGILFYKLAIFVFNIVPLLAMYIAQ